MPEACTPVRAVAPTSVSGLGLGLYIVKKIVEAHGGTVEVTSQLKQGAAFTVWLPVNPADLVRERTVTGSMPVVD